MEQQYENLKLFAKKIRLDILEMLYHRGYGHLGGSMSIVELMSVLYGKQLHIDPANPAMEDRDYVVLSKGHAGPGWYAALAESGYFDKQLLFTLNEGHTQLPSHPDRTKTPGVDMTTGSLGQGCSSAAGIATGLKLKKSERYVYLIVGDGELDEGQCWEAFQYIANYQLNHCIVIIDENKRQLDGYTDQIMKLYNVEEKMKAFGFYTQRVKGNDVAAIDQAIENAKQCHDQAVCIVLDTIKGQGIPFFEEMESNHSVKFSGEKIIEESEKAIAELKEQIRKEELQDAIVM